MITPGIAAALTITLATGFAAEGTVQQAPTTASAPANQSAKDVKGWRGTEWGMSPEKVAAALGQELGEASTPRDYPTHSYYALKGLKVGEWTADVDLGFKLPALGTETSNAQLFFVILSLQGARVDFRSVRDELKTTYGDATSETDERKIQEARWTFPSTQILCNGGDVLQTVSVTFEQRVKAF